MKIWFVVVHREGAKIFERLARRGPVEFREHILNPDGGKKNMELGSDKPGRTKTGGHRSSARYSLSSEIEPKEHVLELFLRSLAEKLDACLQEKKYEGLIIVAESHVLGVLKSMLSDKVTRAIKYTVNKDLFFADERELQKQVEKVEVPALM